MEILSLAFVARALALAAAQVCLALSVQARQNKLRRWSDDIVLLF